MNIVVKAVLGGVVMAVVSGAAIHNRTYALGPDGFFLSRSAYREQVTNHVLFPSAGASGVAGALLVGVVLRGKGECSESREEKAIRDRLQHQLASGTIGPQVYADTMEALGYEG